MMRPIDADALMNMLQKLLDKRQKEADFTGSRCVNIGWDDAIYHIKSAPTVDAVEVVRCRDCRYSINAYDGRLCTRNICGGEAHVSDNYFCARGARWSEGGDE